MVLARFSNRESVGGEAKPATLSGALPAMILRAGSRVEKALLILGEDELVPDLAVHGEPDKPAQQKVVIPLLPQQAGAAAGAKDLQHQGAPQLLRGNKRASLRECMA